MTDRKKKGIGYIVSGIISIGVGVILNVTPVTPEWVDVALPIIVFIGSSLGLDVVLPGSDK